MTAAMIVPGSEPRRADIAYCPTHGLHGERQVCFMCGGPVAQIAMVEVGALTACETNARERMEVVELLASVLADADCDCLGEGLDYEGDEWTLCECVLAKCPPLTKGQS